jgi:hypothetical protein
LIAEGTYSVMTGLVPAILVFLASMQQKKWMPGSAKRTLVRPRNEYRDRRSPLEHPASRLIGKARIAETLGEGGEVLLPTKQISQIGGAQIGITFECL